MDSAIPVTRPFSTVAGWTRRSGSSVIRSTMPRSGCSSTARVIAEPDLRPSRRCLPGWTRAYVLAHLARGADAMRNLLVGARSGEDRAAYASAEARAAETEQALRSRSRRTWRPTWAGRGDGVPHPDPPALPDEAWQYQLQILGVGRRSRPGSC